MAISNCNTCEHYAAETCSQNPDYAQAFQSLGSLPEQAQGWVGARLESCAHWQLNYDEELLTAPVQLPRRIWRILAAQTNGLTPLALVAQDLLSDQMVAEATQGGKGAEAVTPAAAPEDEANPAAAPRDIAEPATAADLEPLADLAELTDLDPAENVTAAESLDDLAEGQEQPLEAGLAISADGEDPAEAHPAEPALDEPALVEPALVEPALVEPALDELDSGAGFSAASTLEPQTFEGTPVTVGQKMSEADLEVAIASFLHGISGGEPMTALEETQADISRGSGRVSNHQTPPTVSLPAFRHWPGL